MGCASAKSNNTVVQGNFFGIGANNATAVGNRLNGILVERTSANTQVGGVIPLGQRVRGQRRATASR